jgi:hypothetical protein
MDVSCCNKTFFRKCFVNSSIVHIFALPAPAKPLYNAQIGGAFYFKQYENQLFQNVYKTNLDRIKETLAKHN